MNQKKLLVKGVVQGVGFRPFCAKTALRLSLNGSVKNTSAGVEIILEGAESAIDEFISELWENPPSAAVVSEVKVCWEKDSSPNFSCFTIEESRRDEKQQVFIPADIALCDECLAEMRDKNNRRYRYPFINCTLCGPRYSIINGLPYDRPKTTMRKFPMCPSCEKEYHDPSDRRFHAQPNACPVCGPNLWVHPVDENADPISAIVSRLNRGDIVAVKGIGGFHIACLADDSVIRELRRRKARPHKPFALMMRDAETARKYLDISHNEEKLLMSPQSPIVLLSIKTINVDNNCDINKIFSAAVPQQKSIGVMLPYTPIHHLIMENFEMLVMTSANISESPIIYDNDDSGLLGVADAVLMHDRDIDISIDDSVIVLPFATGTGGERDKKLFLRRARGFVPNPISFSGASVPILGAGADIKSAFAISQDSSIFPSQYLGDLRSLRTAEYYRRALRHFSKLYSITPEVLVHDAHPDYFSTKLGKEFADEFGIKKVIPVQHHAAHFAAALLDSGLSGPAIGVIFDGIGYGDDGNVWGGEFLFSDGTAKIERIGTLFPCLMPGGDKASEQPWRYALSMLYSAVGADAAKDFAASNWARVPRDKVDSVLKSISVSQNKKKFGGTFPLSSSCGRLFDGISALLSICIESSFEGHAAMALEGAASDSGPLTFEIFDGELPMLDWRHAVREIVRKRQNGEDVRKIAGAFHSGFARAIIEMCRLLSSEKGILRVALSGGVWQNQMLLNKTFYLLNTNGFETFLHGRLSPNDENIAVGQIAIASAML